MVSHLVAEDEGNRTLEEIASGSEGPDVSKRVEMATQILRPDTAQMVLGRRQTLFLENHPLLALMDWSFVTFGVQGTISASSSGPSLCHLDIQVPMDTLEGDALVSSLMSDHADSPILKGVVDPAAAVAKNPNPIIIKEIIFDYKSCLK